MPYASLGIAAKPAAATAPGSLLGRRLDPLLLGGLSLVVPLGVAAALEGPATRAPLARLEHFLALGVVLPHFLTSYQLLYWDYRRRLLEPRFFAAAVGVPLALLAVLADIFLSRAPVVPLWLLVQAMFFLSGWHYLKQCFGCAVAGCAMNGTSLSKPERSALLGNLWALAALAFFVPNCSPRAFSFVGLPYASLGLPHALVWAAAVALAATTARLLWLLARRPTPPPASAIASVLAFYAWSLPIIANPGFFYTFRFVPLAAALHAVQYLAFAAPLRWRRVQRAGASASEAATFAGGWALMIAIAPWVFYKAPGWLDARLAYDHALLGPVFFVGAVHLFVNIHHYFIDSVIWRRDNPEFAALLAERAGLGG